jgi:hypothetical protein
MRHLIAFTIFCVVNISLAQEALWQMNEEIMLNRARLQTQLQENIEDEVQEPGENSNAPHKSVGLAVTFSAVVPGTGQLYAGSYWKAALFAAAEVVGWTINISNNNKGDNQTAQFEAYADQNWSEQRYWSFVYDYLNGTTEDQSFPHGVYDDQIFLDHANRPLIENWQEAEPDLQPFAANEYISGFSHHLPDSKTQQYYEMIGKYPEQFGNAWDDASFEVRYRGDYGSGSGNITAMNREYATMRETANDYYNTAGIGSMVILVNHVLSAVDAGFTARSFNRRQLKVTYQGKNYLGEYVDMVGLSVGF